MKRNRGLQVLVLVVLVVADECGRAVDAVSRAQRIRRRRGRGLPHRVLDDEKRRLEDGRPQRAVVARRGRRSGVPHRQPGRPAADDRLDAKTGSEVWRRADPARANAQDLSSQRPGFAHACRRRSGRGRVLRRLRPGGVRQRREGSVASSSGPLQELLRDGRLADHRRRHGRPGVRSARRLLCARARPRQRARALEDRADRTNHRVGDADGVQAGRTTRAAGRAGVDAPGRLRPGQRQVALVDAGGLARRAGHAGDQRRQRAESLRWPPPSHGCRSLARCSRSTTENKDGRLSAAEFKADPDLGEHFGWLDENSDGIVERAEWAAAREMGVGEFGALAIRPGTARGSCCRTRSAGGSRRTCRSSRRRWSTRTCSTWCATAASSRRSTWPPASC